MVSMNVCIKDAGDLPPVLCSQVKIYLWVKRSINDQSFILCPKKVRKASFSCAPHLKHPHSVASERDFSNVPGQTPPLHPAFQGQRLDPTCGQLIGGNLTGFASRTHGHDRSIP